MNENNPYGEEWTWEKAYKKWFVLRFTLLLIALVLSIILCYIYFVKLPQYDRIIDDQSYYIPSRRQYPNYNSRATSTSEKIVTATTSSALTSH